MSRAPPTIDAVLSSREDPTRLFDLLEELAVGSYGHVYKAIYKPTGDIVALKIIALEEDDTFEEMMIEIQVLERCVGHENVVKYCGSWKKGEELFIAMELCSGGSANDLYQVLEQPLQEAQIAWITQESLKGLMFLHEKGIIHRDIKAANILLTDTGDVKLTDFGVSAQMENPKDKRRTFIGTPYWIAPEVVNTVIAPYDEKCDIWSLGITCIELAELQPPLHEIAPMTAVMQIPKNPPPKLTNPQIWTPEFSDFLKQCFIKDPSFRPSAAQLLQHPWFKMISGDSGQLLVPTIRRSRAAEEAYAASTDPDPAVSPSEEYADEGYTDAVSDDLPPLPEEAMIEQTNGHGYEPDQIAPVHVESAAPQAQASPVGSPATLRNSSVANSPAFQMMTEAEKREALHAERKKRNAMVEQQKRPTLTRTLKKENAASSGGC
eukprot:TRINITY_DN2058_c1_g1_i1.p1 TRINITY_DN2058_c1_g1~~TRINITY_DN2058_c1_g1_i1.p1  ORF type:complete len:446 (+),score=78.24 TRINITY_DN2058_c1_g1_i1:34-1338(+)